MEGPNGDPYSLYLELPPGPRPPHYYDLLGLELFCSHHERIESAVRKLFRLLKPYQEHPDRATRETIQDMMNRVAQARVVLTDPPRKDAYDKALAEKLGIDRDAHLAMLVAAPLPEFELVVIAGPSNIDERVKLVEGATIDIGADTSCTLPLKCGRLAGRHCRVKYANGNWWIQAFDAGTQLRVNNEACTESLLNDADFFDVGGYRIRVARTKERGRPPGAEVAPPLSLIIQRGPSIISPTFNMLAPQRVEIGSVEPALWLLPHPDVDRRHCAIQSVGNRWEVEDLGGSGRTRINNNEIMRHMLRDRDVLTIGPFEVLASLRL
jgi:pSer/pThr/pTyr-binding forkhead associated (FHA) protein